jgi:hypothetical protein
MIFEKVETVIPFIAGLLKFQDSKNRSMSLHWRHFKVAMIRGLPFLSRADVIKFHTLKIRYLSRQFCQQPLPKIGAC